MNVKRIILAAAAFVMLATDPARGQDRGSDLFAARDLSLDLFGFRSSADRGGADKVAWGPGVGMNYFITRNIGVGADTYADAFELPYQVNFSAMYRYPLDRIPVAPYAVGGFGRQWDNRAQWLAHIGGGAEYRFGERTGVFAEIRGVFPENTRDAAVFRFGFRLKLF